MPLPRHGFTLHGGCHCKAVRYEVEVPQHSERPITPYRTPGADVGDATIPAVYVCHCPDCRSHSTAIPLMVFVTDTRTVRVALTRSSDVSPDTHGPLPHLEDLEGDPRRSWLPAIDMFDHRNRDLEKTFLTVYKSSPNRSRWFCRRCGTSLAYTVDPGVIPADWGWPPMLDLYLGTLDQRDLEPEYMKPERMLWCERAVPWVRKWATYGAGGIPEHPLTKIDELERDENAGHVALDR